MLVKIYPGSKLKIVTVTSDFFSSKYKLANLYKNILVGKFN